MYKEGDQVELTVGETTLVGRIESLGPLDDELILLIGVAEGDTASLPDGAELKVNSKDRAYVFGRGRMIGGPVALDVRVTELHD